MTVSLLLLQVDRGDVTDTECGGCRFAQIGNNRQQKRIRYGATTALRCLLFATWCGGALEKPERVPECIKAEKEAFRE